MGINISYERNNLKVASKSTGLFRWPVVTRQVKENKEKGFYRNTQITKKELVDAYECLLFYPLKKYGHLLHSGLWGDRKIDYYQTWAIETIEKSIEDYDRSRGMKFSSYALLRARWWMIYKYKIQDQRDNAERVAPLEDKILRVNLSQLEAQVQKHILGLLSEEDKLFVELKYGLSGRNSHTWAAMCKIYDKNYNFGLRIRMKKIMKELQKVVNFDVFDI